MWSSDRRFDENLHDNELVYRGDIAEKKQFFYPYTVMPVKAFRDWFPWALGVAVFVSRALVTPSVPYWADGPRHIEAVRSGRLLIQPPGYWLFNYLAGLFSDPQFGIEVMNWSFSALGCIALYAGARLLVDRSTARFAAGAYASLYFTWFSGSVHSTYPAELLFPPLMFLCILSHHRSGNVGWLLGAALSFALAAGFRPSDGVFLTIMFLTYLFLEVPLQQAVVAVSAATGLCAVWFIPTWLGFHSNALEYTKGITSMYSIIARGLNYRSLANIVRFFLPLVAAFWLLVPLVARTCRYFHYREVQLLWLWVLPGSLFFVFVFITDAPYMNFLTGAVILLAAIGCGRSQPRLTRIVFMALIAWNVALFLLFTPFQSQNFSTKVLNTYVGKYTLHGLQHHVAHNLSDVVDRDKPF